MVDVPPGGRGADIVDNRVAKDVVHRILCLDVDAALADHDSQFHFPIELSGGVGME